MATITIVYNSETRRVSGITRTTTCDDVIKVLLRNAESNEKENAFSFAIFESVGGIERLLPGDTRLLKLQNSWGDEIEKVKFVLRKSHCLGLVPKISIARRKRLREKRKPVSPSVDSSRHCPKTICNSVSERKESARLLVQLTQAQKTKIHKIKDKITGLDKGLNKFRLGLRFKKFANAKVKSTKEETSEADSMDEFLANVNEDNMEDLLNFCDKVASQELSRLVPEAGCSFTQSDVSTKNNTKEEEDCSVDILDEKLKEVQHVLHKYSQSTRTLQKAGVDIATETAVLQNEIISRQKTCHFLTKKIFSVEGSSKPQVESAVSRVQIIPMHSTPICSRAMSRSSRDGNDDDLHKRPRDLKKYLPTGRSGKRILMQNYLKQQSSLATLTPNWVVHEEHLDTDNNGSDTYSVVSKIIKTPKFNTLQERCKFYWDTGYNSDSDSDTGGSDASFGHDLGFMDRLPLSPKHVSAENSVMSDHFVFSFFESPSIIEPSSQSLAKTTHGGKRLVDYSIESEESYDDTAVTVSKSDRCNVNSLKSHSDSDTGLSSLGNEKNILRCQTYLV